MIILVFPDGSVDFEAPTQFTDDQKERFLEFMQNLFVDVDIEEVEEKRRYTGESESTSKRWTMDDYYNLLNNPEKLKESGRSGRSIQMKYGEFAPAYAVWIKQKKYAQSVKKEYIKEFLESQNE